MTAGNNISDREFSVTCRPAVADSEIYSLKTASSEGILAYLGNRLGNLDALQSGATVEYVVTHSGKAFGKLNALNISTAVERRRADIGNSLSDYNLGDLIRKV